MKKINKIIVLLFTVIFLTGCAANADILKDATGENEIVGEKIQQTDIVPIVKREDFNGTNSAVLYKKVSDMVKAINSMDFSPEMIEDLKKAHLIKDDAKGNSVFATSQKDIYVAKLPAGEVAYDKIIYETKFTVQEIYESDITASMSFLWFHNDAYVNTFAPANADEEYSYLTNTEGMIMQEVIRHGVATKEYTKVNPDRVCKLYIYTLTEGNKTLYICELYITESTSTVKAFQASAYPKTVSIYGIDNGEHFEVSINQMKTDVTNEWLLEFGLQKYQSDVVTE